MCWFNPLMWVAMRKSAEDLELSCDETVLLEAGEDTRRQYADLLLKTAGDERGFTTCLSASASALRYRLRGVVDPKKKPSGALAVGLAFFLLCMSCGYTALAFEGNTGAEAIYQSRDPEEFSLRLARWEEDPYDATLVCTDESALGKYLSELPMEEVSGNYSFEPEGKALTLCLNAPDDLLQLTISDQWLKLSSLYKVKEKTRFYYLPGGIDWDTLGTWFVESPGLNLRLTRPEDAYGRDINASLWRSVLVDGDRTEVVYERDAQETPSGIFGHYRATEAELSFSARPQGNVEVEIAPADGGEGATVTLWGQTPTLALWDGPARYTVRGEFLDRYGRLLRTEFKFELGEL